MIEFSMTRDLKTLPVEFKKINLEKLLQQTYHLPEVQRGYEWEQKNIEQLIEDICNHYNEFQKNGHIKNTYYCGTILTAQEEEKFLLLDGQQRLTSFIIIMKSIEIIIMEKKSALTKSTQDEIHARHINKIVDFIGHLIKKSTTPSLTTSKINHFITDHTDYINLITCEQDIVEIGFLCTKTTQEKFLPNYKNSPFSHYIDSNIDNPLKSFATNLISSIDFLNKFFESKKTQTLEEYIRFIENFITTIIYSIELIEINKKSDSEIDVTTLFESINDRGLSLGIPDKIKTTLLANLTDDDKELLGKLFEDEIKDCASNNFLTLEERFHYFIVAIQHRYQDHKTPSSAVKKSEIPDFLKKLVRENLISPFDFYTEFRKTMEIFDSLFNKLYIADQQLHFLIHDFRKSVLSKNAIPMIIASLINADPSTPLGKESFIKKIKNIIFFCFKSMKIQSISSTSLLDISQKASYFISINKMQELIKLFETSHPNFINDLINWSPSSQNLRQLGFFYFWIEFKRMKGATPNIHSSLENHIEHILPKSPKKSDWPFYYSIKNGSPEEKIYFENITWNLGNMMLLDSNTNIRAKNVGILKKANLYSTSSLTLPKDVLNSSLTAVLPVQWGANEIDTRKIYLITLAVDAFAYEI